ncbi:hypothetical protein EH196_20265, partial [Bacillus sp. C1-1]
MANIQPRGKNSYFFTVYAKNPYTGKNERKTMTYKVEEKMSSKKLERHLLVEYEKFAELVKSGEFFTPQKMTVDDFATLWIANYLETLEGASYNAHTSKYKHHIKPVLGDKQITAIKS